MIVREIATNIAVSAMLGPGKLIIKNNCTLQRGLYSATKIADLIRSPYLLDY